MNFLFQQKLAGWLALILMINMSINFSEAAPNLKQEEPAFQLHILKKRMDQLKLYGELEASWAILKEIDLSSERSFVINEGDIESYNWPDQSITLTPETSTRLLNKCFPEKEEVLSWSMVELALNRQVFLVILKGEKLYGGVFIYPESAQGTSYPVIYSTVAAITHIEPLELQVMFVVRPKHSVMGLLNGYKAQDPSIKSRIEIQKVHDFFQKIGKLTNNADPRRVEPWIPKIEPTLKVR